MAEAEGSASRIRVGGWGGGCLLLGCWACFCFVLCVAVAFCSQANTQRAGTCVCVDYVYFNMENGEFKKKRQLRDTELYTKPKPTIQDAVSSADCTPVRSTGGLFVDAVSFPRHFSFTYLRMLTMPTRTKINTE